MTSTLQNHFVKSFAHIADKLNSVQQPAGTTRLSGEIVRFFLNFDEDAINADIAAFMTTNKYSN
ncbi:hypothetical protein [Lapidilactobacillus salsurivasis]